MELAGEGGTDKQHDDTCGTFTHTSACSTLAGLRVSFRSAPTVAVHEVCVHLPVDVCVCFCEDPATPRGVKQNKETRENEQEEGRAKKRSRDGGREGEKERDRKSVV